MMTRQETTPGTQTAERFQGAWNKRFLVAYFAVAAIAVFYLPYIFPVRPSTSDSYIFGYNNAVGCALLLVLAFAGAFWTRRALIDFPMQGQQSPKVRLSVLCMALTAIGCACASLYVLSGRFDPPWEGKQILNRAYLLTLGKRPYIDFEFPWGPAFLYPAKWLSESFPLSIIQSYAIIWGLGSLVSVYLLYVAINWIDIPARNRTTIFLLFSFVALLSVGNMGLNYTLLRYVCPLVFVLVVFRLLRRESEAGGRLAACASAILFSASLFLISPEVAISFVFACVVLLWPAKQAPVRWLQWVSYLAVVTGFALLVGLGYRFHLLDSLFLDGGGANGIPIALGPATLAYFAAVYVCACYLVQRFRRQGKPDNTIAIILFSIPMSAAALGRCDPGHILLNGMGLFLVVLLYASASGRWWRLCRNLFIACPLGLYVLLALIATAIGMSTPKARDFSPNGDIATLYPTLAKNSIRQRFAIPFGYEPNARGYFVSSQIDYGFFYGGADANTPQAIGREMEELRNNPKSNLLLGPDFAKQCEVDQRHERVVVSALSGFPYLARVANPQSVREPLCGYIRAHYVLAEPASDRNFEYGLWTPRR